MLPVPNSLPVIESLPLSAMQMSPSIPPAGPVMSTFPPSSCRTVQIGGCDPDPIRGLAQLVGHTGTVHTFSSLLVTVRPLAPATSQLTTTSSHASAVSPLTLPIADAIAPGPSDATAAAVAATGVPAPPGRPALFVPT